MKKIFFSAIAMSLFSISFSQNLRLGDTYNLFLRSGTDVNHGLGWYNTWGPTSFPLNINGPVLFGWNGGALGYINGSGKNVVIRWNNGSTEAGSNTTSKIDFLANFRANDYNLYLRTGTNIDHGLGYNALSTVSTVDGPVLFGWGGGALGSTNSTPGKRIALTWDNMGRVGIGINAPAAKLHVHSTDGAYSFGLLVSGNAANVKAISVNDQNGANNFLVYANGQVFAREVTVQLNSFPDYVFKKSYSLMPLSELENYIQTNSHLPGFPTAKEVETEGMHLSEINKLLVEKIEELTLHVIELKKEIDQIKSTK